MRLLVWIVVFGANIGDVDTAFGQQSGVIKRPAGTQTGPAKASGAQLGPNPCPLQAAISAYLRREYVVALSGARRCADAGNAFAQRMVSTMLDVGEGAALNRAESDRYLKLAAAQGDGDARARLAAGGKLEIGRSPGTGSVKIQEDYIKAVALIRPAAERGEAEAENWMSMFYARGLGVVKSEIEAATWLRRAADHGSSKAMLQQFLRYEHGVPKDEKQALSYLRGAAKADNALAEILLGSKYEMGENVQKDYGEAESLYSRASKDPVEGGYAFWLLGELYSTRARAYATGDGVAKSVVLATKSYETAAEFFEKAVALGYPDAASRLGAMYETGNQIPANYDEVERFYRKYAEMLRVMARDDRDSTQRLAELYSNSARGIPKDEDLAVRLYVSAAERGEYLSSGLAADYYEHGHVVPQDLLKAYVYYTAAARGNDDKVRAGRERVRKALTPAQLKEAETLLAKWRDAGANRVPWTDVGLSPLDKVVNTRRVDGNGGPLLSAPGQIIYVSDCKRNVILTYRVYERTGELMPTPEEVESGKQPRSMAVDPSGRFLYVVNAGSDSVSAYRIDRSTGVLGPIAGSPFPAGSGPLAIVIEPSGKFAYVANAESESVSGYKIDSMTGALTPIPGSPFGTGASPTALALDPAGRFAYIGVAAGILTYRIDAATGAIFVVPESPSTCKSVPESLAVAVDGRFVYALEGTGNVSAHRVEASSGALGEASYSQFEVGALPMNSAVVLEPSGKYMYVAATVGASRVWAFGLDSTTGAVTAVAGSPFSTTVGPSSLASDPLGKLLYVGGWIASYRIGAEGALTRATGTYERREFVSDACAIAIVPSNRGR